MRLCMFACLCIDVCVCVEVCVVCLCWFACSFGCV